MILMVTCLLSVEDQLLIRAAREKVGHLKVLIRLSTLLKQHCVSVYNLNATSQLPDFAHLSSSVVWNSAVVYANMRSWNTIKCAFIWLHIWIVLFNRSSKVFIKNADPVRRTL